MSHMGLDARKPVFRVCEQQSCRPDCTYVQSDQHLCYLLSEKYSSSIAEETGLSLALSEIPKNSFVTSRPIYDILLLSCTK